MKLPALAAALLASLAPFAAPASAQISLDVSGGIIGESAVFTLAGSVPAGEFVVLTFGQTKGPTPVALLLPGQPGEWDLDLTMFEFPAFLQIAPVVNPLANADLTFLSPSLVGVHLFAQAWTAPGPTSFLDLKSNVVTLLFGLHGVTTPTLSPPLAPHAYFSQVALTDGDVLLSGGGNGLGGAGTGLAEVYEHEAAEFAPTANPPIARAGGTAVRLPDGRVLLAGGIDSNTSVTTSCELYDPATRTFASTGSMATPRALHAAVLLNDGRVLVCGGSTSVSGTDLVTQLLSIVSNSTASAEIYNPGTGTWSGTGNMSGGQRTGHVAALLPDGRVLAAGGVQPGLFPFLPPVFLSSSTRFTPGSGTWANTSNSMNGGGRALSSVTTLNDGRVMVAGGLTASILTLSASAVPAVSIFNNGSGLWEAGVAALPTARYTNPLTTLPDGRIVAAGGVTGDASSTTTPTVIATVHIYTPAANIWSLGTPLLEPRSAHGATLTIDGKRILYAGGANSAGTITPATSELYVP